MFRALYVHHQEVEFINAPSGIVTLSKWPSDAQIERELVPSSLLMRSI